MSNVEEFKDLVNTARETSELNESIAVWRDILEALNVNLRIDGDEDK